MSWQQFHHRQHAIRVLLRRLRHRPELLDEPRPPEDLRDAFDTSAQALCVLQHKWIQQLTGRIDVAAIEVDRHGGDRLEAVRRAWRRTSTSNAVLRATLDRHARRHAEHSEELRAAMRGEQRMLAVASGLADHGEPDSEITRAGEALQRLLRAGETEADTRRELATA